MTVRGIKAAVIAMGVVIVIGFVVVVVTIVDRLAGSDEPEVLGEVAVTMPAGCRLADAWSEAGRLYLRYDGEGACQQVAIVDPESGAVVGRVAAAASD